MDSTTSGFPLKKLTFISRVSIIPSSSAMYIPVILPFKAKLLSKIFAFLKQNVAVPVLPSRERVNRISGKTFSNFVLLLRKNVISHYFLISNFI